MLKLFNTLSRKKDEFVPLEKGKVKMYSCGPTVYNFAHIGNFRAYLAADLLRRYLEFLDYDVEHVMNITDVDDKTIRDSQEEGVSLKKFTKKYTDAFFEDLDALNIKRANHYPLATETIPEMVRIIKTLEKKGLAYQGDDKSWYFKVANFTNYGKLSRIKKDELKAGARVSQDEYEKDSVSDFALWKAWTKADGDVFWEDKLGKGRPGWHIECSAMSTKFLGNKFDIHTGGIDLVFPHHENEIAQSEGCMCGSNPKKSCQQVNYWIHNEWLLVNNKKMSKSLGNFFTPRDLLAKGYSPQAIRYCLISTHYRVQLNFTEEGLNAAAAAIDRLNELIRRLRQEFGDEGSDKDISKLIELANTGFTKEMDDDLNISNAMAHVFEFLKKMNKLIDNDAVSKAAANSAITFLEKIDSVIGIMDFSEQKISSDIETKITEREKARADKNWKLADKIRDELKSEGIELLDSAKGTEWKRI